MEIHFCHVQQCLELNSFFLFYLFFIFVLDPARFTTCRHALRILSSYELKMNKYHALDVLLDNFVKELGHLLTSYISIHTDF